MSKDWEYAIMSKKFSDAGGPDKWVELIKKGAYDAGASDMKNKLVLPLLATGVGIGAVCVAGGQKIHKWIVEKKQERLITEQEAVNAEKYLKKELSEAVEELQTENEKEE